ncbi:bifunctional phosphopantothenoylcysteine decarboxylase/phosphopantothenate--cysteine ligase CoaBC [Neiella litorisoli]|uniref:bifunctional phosphopantothenoylcysteine decarboxylase/phosphopantothenate--cysteine ligase CoaBC n=1 Tax=Neiella litorisoli TaxID=2771431 RepID=UPI001CD0BE42|nr:bifunctional phosphopantothenoylcysteine decarboxylase/phosphopantothenate--cysteine ligase CoaBC [Neiella litorisoli]
MFVLTNKRILIGITGGIAAYKIPELVRRLKDLGADVRVVMTPASEAFITPLTLQAVSGHPVADSLLDPNAEAAMGHIELARWADLVLIAPASADFIARYCAGMGNDLLSTLCLATTAPVVIAPAMNQQMWQATATQHNMQVLAERNVPVWGPAQGSQACGEVGPGRMLEPTEILAKVQDFLLPEQLLSGKKIAITAGPTREALDPVRYISNHSSGKMGFALAAEAARMGAEVTLISGPVNLPTPAGCQRVDVTSAQQMLDAALAVATEQDVFIGCAAVADYRAANVASQKMKKQGEQLSIELVKNPDIIATVAAQSEATFVVGFAAETQQVEQYARSKLAAKGLDMIAANDVSNSSIGFNADDNALTVFWPNGQQAIAQASKQQVAAQLLQLIQQQIQP